MKARVKWGSRIAVGLMVFGWIGTGNAQASAIPPVIRDLDPAMTGPEYRTLLEDLRARKLLPASDPALDPILDMGKRNLDWLAFINAHRPSDHQLELSTPDTQTAYPITAPSISSPAIIQAKLDELKAQLPKQMTEILFAGADFTVAPPLPDDRFLELVRGLDRVYQMASRWLLQEPYLWQYAYRSEMDVRGYYFLSHESDLQKTLTHWSALSSQQQAQYSEWLAGECHNTGDSVASCRAELASGLHDPNGAWTFHQNYLGQAKAMWDSFFDLQNPRDDIRWTSADPNTLYMPFVTPSDPAVQAWLKDNIEDEWRVGSWHLRLDFSPRSSGPHVVFVAGATPHVNGLGGNEITMDANRSIQEYTTRWTIRHEFGHTLGFPDCYAEFYDPDQGVMINYQMDIDNLMCSRRGHLQPLHVDELRRAYFR
jgi:hypothetical protein